MAEQETKRRRGEFIGCHVDLETHRRLRARAEEQDRSVAAVLRRAVSKELERETKP
jgi:predicted transcriptional regulator